MQVFYTADYLPQQQSCVALGFFDGVHQGHCQVLQAAKSLARQNGLQFCCFSFHSDTMKKGSCRLGTQAQKEERMQQLGVQLLFCPHFQTVCNFTPQQFFDQVLLQQLGAKAVVCGYDFTFGKGAAGDVQLLRQLCTQKGVHLQVLGEYQINGAGVHTAHIKECIATGQIQQANQLLGYPFYIEGIVEHGRRLGRTLNFPTINVSWPKQIIQPKRGVYFSKVTLADGRVFCGVSNLGIKPTVGGQQYLCETNLLGVDKDLYGQLVKIELLNFVRSEKKFDNVQQLKAAVLENIDQAKKFFNL